MYWSRGSVINSMHCLQSRIAGHVLCTLVTLEYSKRPPIKGRCRSPVLAGACRCKKISNVDRCVIVAVSHSGPKLVVCIFGHHYVEPAQGTFELAFRDARTPAVFAQVFKGLHIFVTTSSQWQPFRVSEATKPLTIWNRR